MDETTLKRIPVHQRSTVFKLAHQIKLLLWKRYCETTKTKWDIIKIILPALLFFVLLILLYEVFTFFAGDGIEPFLVPFAFWIFVQRLVVQIMFEKSTRLQESMRMMGLSDFAYWTSYIISDGIITGFLLAFFCTIFTVGGLFNEANFGEILGLLFVFCLSAVPFAFFLCAFFDTPQTSGQATLALLLGFYIIYVVIFPAKQATIPLYTAQVICCFFPPMALQIGTGAFQKSYPDRGGLPLSGICGIMVADIFIYSILAWYFAQVWPSKVGIAKPFYFPLLPSYWLPQRTAEREVRAVSDSYAKVDAAVAEEGNAIANANIPTEAVNENLLGAPTVAISHLRKTFNGQKAVNDLSFNMYENQIFALLGHNGAGKTTCINVLTGMTNADYTSDVEAMIYGHSILTDMDQIRYSMGVCPQHDVLFENLSVREHILFFAQLKGYTYEEADAEAVTLAHLFHLENRIDHLGSELSGGQKRKLSVAIAVCGGSKFVVLDEPTAGMDPLARRELWDLLASLRKGRTMLLTTHYMDEADILGDRVGIMSLGQMQCIGSTQFLKSTYGAGYKLIFDKAGTMDADNLAALTKFVQTYVPEAKYIVEDGAEEQVLYNLPFNTVKNFGPLFTKLDECLGTLHVSNYGVTITSLEDVFLKVGEDHSVTPHGGTIAGIGSDRQYKTNFFSQVYGIAGRKLTYASNDFITLPLVLLPVAAAIAAAVIYRLEIISKEPFLNNLVTVGIYLGGYLGAPGLIAEFIVRERDDKLRNVLTVMGCGFNAYWLGTFIADFILMSIPMVCMWITWGAAHMPDFYDRHGGFCFFLMILFTIQMVAFSYFFSFIFTSPKSCISFMPVLVIVLIILPNILVIIGIQIAIAAGTTITPYDRLGFLLWGILILSPHGALYNGLLSIIYDYSEIIPSLPPIGAVVAIMIAETAFFIAFAYYTDMQSVRSLQPLEDPYFDPKVLEGLDSDVQAERDRTAAMTSNDSAPLILRNLRKVFPPKQAGRKAVIAAEDIALAVGSGEILGLLGANGAGKTTMLSMLTRHLTPTSGDAFVCGNSILSDFTKGATSLGVVTQNNSLWDRLSVKDHLLLFARLRGVPEDLVKQVVDGTIDQLELTPHRDKLSMRLSGGMKRKLCVAIALIGDPKVVLLDEPSAGLDPVSRRNLWSVILRTMSHRAVILTTHSMDEAEALCRRIGIMTQGQIRALGTKQHLKNKFGSGFELVVKIHVTDHAAQIAGMTEFVKSFFPEVVVLAENGGLITYQIPREEMKMGVAFSQLEANKERLRIEDYSIAQPTLEQVFIRTVHKYENIRTDVALTGHDELKQVTNKCGCTNRTVKIMSGVACAMCITFIVIAIAVFGRSNPSAFSIFFIIGVIGFIISLVGCFIVFCSCCQPPKGVDEK